MRPPFPLHDGQTGLKGFIALAAVASAGGSLVFYEMPSLVALSAVAAVAAAWILWRTLGVGRRAGRWRPLVACVLVAPLSGMIAGLLTALLLSLPSLLGAFTAPSNFLEILMSVVWLLAIGVFIGTFSGSLFIPLALPLGLLYAWSRGVFSRSIP